MSKEISVPGTPARRRSERNRNMILFPRELRDAIPDLHGGRLLELVSIDGKAGTTLWSGRSVHLTMLVAETGKLKGKFEVRVDLQPDAARALAETLVKLADQLV
jgi:hypothetical protein